MTVTNLRETIRPRWVNATDLEYVASALPGHPTSIADRRTMEEETIELTGGLHAITAPSGRRWLIGTDVYRLHALQLDTTNPLPDGSYRLEADGCWTRYPAAIDTSRLAPYVATAEHQDPPVELKLSDRLVATITSHQRRHPLMVVFLRNARTQLHRSLQDLDLVEVIDARPVRARNGTQTVAIQWPVIQPAVESGMTKWAGTGPIGPWRSDLGRRTAVALGVHQTAPAIEVAS